MKNISSPIKIKEMLKHSRVVNVVSGTFGEIDQVNKEQNLSVVDGVYLTSGADGFLICVEPYIEKVDVNSCVARLKLRRVTEIPEDRWKNE